MRRPIIATFIREGRALMTRRYVKIDNAVPRTTQVLMWSGQPRDVVEFSHADTGLQLGTIKVHAGGKLTTDYIWDQ